MTARILQLTSFGGVCLVVLLSPWLFGAWEQWWFWPFTALIFLSTLAFAGQLILSAAATDGAQDAPGRQVRVAVLLCALFTGYACVRFLQAEVFADAERNFLRFLTPLLLAAQVLFGFSRRQARWLFALLLADLCLLGLYGLINHALNGSRLVLGCERYAQYAGRLTGSYYCPDHFAGVMELALGLCLGLLLTRAAGRAWQTLAGLVAAIALTAIVWSKSRGAGLTVLVLLAAAAAWGLGQWPPIVRRRLRFAGAALALAALVLFVHLAPGYVTRFGAYFGWDQARGQPFAEKRRIVLTHLEGRDRPQMIAGALRAWRSSPRAMVFGIGPGMHQNLWPHFAASADGDRAAHKWPKYPNNTYHSYEVHSDWVQLLEEYGLVGLLLFLAAAAAAVAALLAELRRESRDLAERQWRPTGDLKHAVVLGALLGIAALGFHSLGDFNLQMPATVWLLGAIAALAGAETRPDYPA